MPWWCKRFRINSSFQIKNKKTWKWSKRLMFFYCVYRIPKVLIRELQLHSWNQSWWIGWFLSTEYLIIWYQTVAEDGIKDLDSKKNHFLAMRSKSRSIFWIEWMRTAFQMSVLHNFCLSVSPETRFWLWGMLMIKESLCYHKKFWFGCKFIVLLANIYIFFFQLLLWETVCKHTWKGQLSAQKRTDKVLKRQYYPFFYR